MSPDDALRHDIVEVGRRLWVRGFVASNDGNISVRLDAERLLVTPASVSKGFMAPDMMVVTDLDGAADAPSDRVGELDRDLFDVDVEGPGGLQVGRADPLHAHDLTGVAGQ